MYRKKLYVVAIVQDFIISLLYIGLLQISGFFMTIQVQNPISLLMVTRKNNLLSGIRQYGIILKRDMAKQKKYKDKIEEAFSDPEKITQALVRGVREALLKHKQAGNPIVIWKDGKTVWLKPEEIPVP